jgi:glyoxylase I family protein
MNNMKPTFLDHIVLIVQDLQRSKDFYDKFLGEAGEKYDDSISYQIGDTKIFFGLPYKEHQAPDKDAGGINHLAFGVRTIEELKRFEKLLTDKGIKNSGLQVERDSKRDFIWFDDPDGYRLEFYLRSLK